MRPPSPWKLAELRDREYLRQIHPAGDLVASTATAMAAGGAAAGRDAHAFFVPGRLEMVGKHTDYAGGRSLIGATERGFGVVVLPRTDQRVRIFDVGRRRHLELRLEKSFEEPTRRWARYPATVVRRVVRNFPADALHRLYGADIAFNNNLPSSAGLSTSSAFIISIYLALARTCQLGKRLEYQAEIRSVEDLATYLGTVENGQSFGRLEGDSGIGTYGGSEDHTAILCSEAGKLSSYSFDPLRLEKRIDLPEGLLFAIGASGVRASKAGRVREAYNRLSQSTTTAAAWWRQHTGGREPHLAAILASASVDDVCRVLENSAPEGFSATDLIQRVRHFAEESEEIVPAATAALAQSDFEKLGEIVDRSQAIGAKLLGNQVPETVFLAESAREAGALAASAFGAGFGGSVWALVREEDAADFLDDWEVRYDNAFPRRSLRNTGTGPLNRDPLFFLTGLADGARELRP